MAAALLPEYLDFIQKAKIGCEINGIWPVNKLERLSDLLVDNGGELQAELSFGQKEGLRYVTGSLALELGLICQRCMQPMKYPLNIEFSLGLITDENQAEKLPEDYEPFLVEEDRMSLPAMLEDEILLAMPLVAMHETDCSDYLVQQKTRQQQEAEQEEESENPFSVLKDLLK